MGEIGPAAALGDTYLFVRSAIIEGDSLTGSACN